MSSNGLILVVDDERDHADGIAEALEKCPAELITVYTPRDAIEILRTQTVDVVVSDLRFDGDIDGLDILEQAKQQNQNAQIILITAYATIENCKQAIKRGAYDYLVKPIDIDQLRTLVTEALRRACAASDRTPPAAGTTREHFRIEGVRGTSPAMKGIFEVLRRVAPADISVLIEGPSGTGKELLAKAIHDNSKRKHRPFRPLNCAGLSETLLESELFGHVRGAFTGATADRKGLFEIADTGTLFLDEIGDMPLNMQAKFLRVLEDGIVTPVGSTKATVVNVRIISATNQDLTMLIEKARFRQDLYFRIKGVSISLPPLRERAEDIPDFVDYFLREAVTETGAAVTGITEAAKNVLVNYDWPGNIRQLKNCIRTMVVMSDSEKLDVPVIPPEIHRPRQLAPASQSAALVGLPLAELEKQAIIETLSKTGNNREKAAKILGIGERTLYRKIKEYNL